MLAKPKPKSGRKESGTTFRPTGTRTRVPAVPGPTARNDHPVTRDQQTLVHAFANLPDRPSPVSAAAAAAETDERDSERRPKKSLCTHFRRSHATFIIHYSCACVRTDYNVEKISSPVRSGVARTNTRTSDTFFLMIISVFFFIRSFFFSRAAVSPVRAIRVLFFFPNASVPSFLRHIRRNITILYRHTIVFHKMYNGVIIRTLHFQRRAETADRKK